MNTKDADDIVMVKCKNCNHVFDLLSIPESGMGYVKCPKCSSSVIQSDVINKQKS